MTLTINANYLIDEMMGNMDEYETQRREHRKQYPYGQYITNDTPYMNVITHINQEKAEKAINAVRWILHNNDVYAAAKTARKWYKKNKWQRNLPENTAERLISYYSQ